MNLMALTTIQQLVLIMHILFWVSYLGKVWNVSDFPPGELEDVARKFNRADPPYRPLVIGANAWWRSLLRAGCFTIACLAMVSNYLNGHRSLIVATVFLALFLLTIEIVRWFNKYRYRVNLFFCERAMTTRPTPLPVRS
jgi:hypothetical protein